MLSDILKQNEDFEHLPLDKQELFLILSNKFEATPDNLYSSPDELTQSLQIADHHLWQAFLNLEPVDNYIKQQMAYNTKIAFRKSFQSLQQEALSGDVSAIKQVNELSGILEKKDDNRIVVLHYVRRPELKEEE